MFDLGLVAEEVAKIEPLLVTYKDGRVEGVKYDRIGVVLVNVLKEQQEEIEKLRQELESEKKKGEKKAKQQEEELALIKTSLCSKDGSLEFCKK